ncbi:general secretion pathway protein GspF [Pseudohalioglobus sediminis]|uniref:General secretion pathway protein GspF n=1 Tax=Pseudohalioglobus sediminis TaxID=2606449 RepID=A0A5B0X251_9GAMM|nr:general secretion pathway protein GspF [Pseudohalioglobus sediminis]KAA1192391.1 general secretion pathway protein GspF [Pseudohalioglobus sediminis]
MARRYRFFKPDEALRHPDHHRPISRRELLAQGFRAGGATLLGTSLYGLLGQRAQAISPDLLDPARTPFTSCDLGAVSGRKIPFICFDLAGGANIAGSNVIVGGPGGQRDALSTAGYGRLGLPPDILPFGNNPNAVSGEFTDDTLGLLFHSESAMLRGIVDKATGMRGFVNGAVIPGRSENDTGNNPHNPMYGIYRAGLRGQILQLIGSENSESGGNSMAPAMLIDPEVRPTKVDRPSDASGLVDVGDLNLLLDNPEDIVAVMESMKRITDYKLQLVNTGLRSPTDEDKRLKDRLSCEYLRSADTLEKFSSPDALDPRIDANIVGQAGIFSSAEFEADREFQKAASVMKLVIDGIAGAGTIEMGGYDYHTGDRRTGEARDFRAGQCIGACLDYARRTATPLMIYVFSDGSVSSDGTIELVNGVEKGVWSGDNSSTAASFFLVYDPAGAPQLLDSAGDPMLHQQLGWMRADASVETTSTPAANNVNLNVETIILNYMALHGEQHLFAESGFFPGHGLGSVMARDRLVAFQPLASVSGGVLQ